MAILLDEIQKLQVKISLIENEINELKYSKKQKETTSQKLDEKFLSSKDEQEQERIMAFKAILETKINDLKTEINDSETKIGDLKTEIRDLIGIKLNDIDGNSLIDTIFPVIIGTLGTADTKSLLNAKEVLNVSKWDSFESESLAFFSLDTTKSQLKQMHKKVEFNSMYMKFNSHGISLSFLYQRVLLDFFQYRFFKDDDIEFDQEPNGFSVKPDITFKNKNSDDKIIYFPIEVKCDFNLKDLDNQSIISEYKKNNTRIKQNVHQLYQYMIGLKAKYGLLSSVEKSFFFKNENNTLFISEFINTNKLVRYLYFILSRSKAEYDPKILSNAEIRTKKIPKLKTMAVNYVLKSYPTAPIIGYGRSGCVLKAKISNKQIAIKLTDLNKFKKEILSELDNEINIYKFLNSKNIRCVPLLIWNGLYKIFKAMITEYIEGQHIDFSQMSKDQKKACIDSLQLLHNIKCAHNDLKKENFIIRKSPLGFEEAFIIDFGFSTLNNTMDLLEKEMQEFKCLLSFNDSFSSSRSDNSPRSDNSIIE